MSLDAAFADALALGELPDAYTTGTPNNTALIVSTNNLAIRLQTEIADAEPALQLPADFGALDVNLCVFIAGILAGNTAALASVRLEQIVLGRP